MFFGPLFLHFCQVLHILMFPISPINHTSFDLTDLTRRLKGNRLGFEIFIFRICVSRPDPQCSEMCDFCRRSENKQRKCISKPPKQLPKTKFSRSRDLAALVGIVIPDVRVSPIKNIRKQIARTKTRTTKLREGID